MDEIYLSARSLKEKIGTPVRTIENWAAAGKLAQNEQGKYGLISAYKYQLEKVNLDLGRTKLLLEEKKQELIKRDEDLNQAAIQAKLRKAIAEADKEEALARIKRLEADKLEEKVVDAKEAQAVWRGFINHAKAKLIALPAKLALELTGLTKPEDMQARLDIAVDEVLIELGEGD